MVRYVSKSSGFPTVCHKPVWLTKVLSVAVTNENFYSFHTHTHTHTHSATSNLIIVILNILPITK